MSIKRKQPGPLPLPIEDWQFAAARGDRIAAAKLLRESRPGLGLIAAHREVEKYMKDRRT